jgi:hypothetical protein
MVGWATVVVAWGGGPTGGGGGAAAIVGGMGRAQSPWESGRCRENAVESHTQTLWLSSACCRSK